MECLCDGATEKRNDETVQTITNTLIKGVVRLKNF